MAVADVLEISQHFHFEGNMPWKEEEEIIPYDIYTACSLGELNYVREIISKTNGKQKIDLNKHNYSGWTALMYAAYVGHVNVVNLLLDVEVDVNVKTLRSGSTSLMLAASCGIVSVANVLLQNGADINAQDKQGWSALFYATYQGYQNVVQLFIDNGADKELREYKNDLTPLLAAAKEGHEAVFRVLLDNGANKNAKTGQGENLRQLALRHHNIAIVNILDHRNCLYAPHIMLRSEPGLLGDDLAGDNMPSQRKVQEWLGYHDNRIHGAGIQDGPEAFAKLMSQSKDTRFQQSRYPEIATPRSSVVSSSPQPIPGASPRHTPYSRTPVESVGSPEDYFVNSACNTMRSVSLHERLQQRSLEVNSPVPGSPLNQVMDQRRASECSNSELPSLASFLEDLKLEKYLPVFEQQEFDFESFLSLNDGDLKEVGIKLGPRKKMLLAINRWKAESKVTKGGRGSDKGEVQNHDMATQLQQARAQLKVYQAQLCHERSVQERCLQEEKAKRQQLYDMAKRAQFELQKASSSMASLRSLTGEVLEKINSDDKLKETREKLSVVLDSTTENIWQAVRRVDRILGGNLAASQPSSDSSGISSHSHNGL